MQTARRLLEGRAGLQTACADIEFLNYTKTYEVFYEVNCVIDGWVRNVLDYRDWY